MLGLFQGVVAEQVGDPHTPVADAVAQRQGAGDRLTNRAERRAEPDGRRSEQNWIRRVRGINYTEEHKRAEHKNRHDPDTLVKCSQLAALPGLDSL